MRPCATTWATETGSADVTGQGSDFGDDGTLTNGEPAPSDQGGLSTDEGSESGWDQETDLSIADEERDSVLPNRGRPVTDDLGRLHPETDPMSNDNR